MNKSLKQYLFVCILAGHFLYIKGKTFMSGCPDKKQAKISTAIFRIKEYADHKNSCMVYISNIISYFHKAILQNDVLHWLYRQCHYKLPIYIESVL